MLRSPWPVRTAHPTRWRLWSVGCAARTNAPRHCRCAQRTLRGWRLQVRVRRAHQCFRRHGRCAQRTLRAVSYTHLDVYKRQAQNLTDESYYVYTGNRRYNAQYEEYGPTYSLGLTFTHF